MERTNFTPKQAVVKFCRECVGGKSGNVMECQGDKLLSGSRCPFYRFRAGNGRPSVRRIREMCLQCMNGSKLMVADCTTINCPLYKYRFGTNPNRLENIR